VIQVTYSRTAPTAPPTPNETFTTAKGATHRDQTQATARTAASAPQPPQLSQSPQVMPAARTGCAGLASRLRSAASALRARPPLAPAWRPLRRLARSGGGSAGPASGDVQPWSGRPSGHRQSRFPLMILAVGPPCRRSRCATGAAGKAPLRGTDAQRPRTASTLRTGHEWSLGPASHALKGPFETLNVLNGPFRTTLSGHSHIDQLHKPARALAVAVSAVTTQPTRLAGALGWLAAACLDPPATGLTTARHGGRTTVPRPSRR